MARPPLTARELIEKLEKHNPDAPVRDEEQRPIVEVVVHQHDFSLSLRAGEAW